MDTNDYWKALEDLPNHGDPTRGLEAIKMLGKAVKNDYGVFIACRYTNVEKTEVKQLFMDLDGKKVYMCFTSERKFREASIRDAVIEPIKAKDMVANVMSKQDVFGFVFNPYCSDMAIVPLGMLLGYMLGCE